MYKYGNNAEHSVYKKVAWWPRFESSTMPFVLGHLARQFSETFLHVCLAFGSACCTFQKNHVKTAVFWTMTPCILVHRHHVTSDTACSTCCPPTKCRMQFLTYGTASQVPTMQALYAWRNREALSCNHCCRPKAVSITYSVCVLVASVIRHAMRMRHTVICGLPASTIFSPHYLINGTIFGEKLLNTKCVFWFALQLLCELVLILRRTERDIIKNVHWPSCKVPVTLVRFEWSLTFFF